jgi:hypothetical protein
MTMTMDTLEDFVLHTEAFQSIEMLSTPYAVIRVLNSVVEALNEGFSDLDAGDAVPTQMGYNYCRKGYLAAVQPNRVAYGDAYVWIVRFVAGRLNLR